MQTSWNDTQKIEAYLLEKDQEEQLLFEANLLLRRDLAGTLAWQKQAYALVTAYSRRQTRQEIEAAHQKLFTGTEHAGFRQKILALFGKK